MFSKTITTLALVIVILFSGQVSATLVAIESENSGIALSTDYIGTGNVENMVISDFIPESGFDFHFVRGSKNISDGSDFAAVRRALDTWSDLGSSSVSYNELSPTPRSGLGQNYRNEISWVDSVSFWRDTFGFSSNTIAVALTWYYPNSKRVVERDIYFNDINMDWYADTDSAGKRGKYFVEQIALHELGHIFGLKDIYNPGQSGHSSWMGNNNYGITMYGYSHPNNEDTTLSSVDILAMALAHPVPEPQSLAMFSLVAGFVLVRPKKD